jgi:hypothetical protein
MTTRQETEALLKMCLIVASLELSFLGVSGLIFETDKNPVASDFEGCSTFLAQTLVPWKDI